MRPQGVHQQAVPIRVSRIHALVTKPSGGVPLNPQHGRRKDPDGPSPIVQRLRTEHENGEVVFAGGFDIPQGLKHEVTCEFGFLLEAENGVCFEYRALPSRR
jgi:hypothetical protein